MLTSYIFVVTYEYFLYIYTYINHKNKEYLLFWSMCFNEVNRGQVNFLLHPLTLPCRILLILSLSMIDSS